MKVLRIILALALVFALCLPASAYESSSITTENIIGKIGVGYADAHVYIDLEGISNVNSKVFKTLSDFPYKTVTFYRERYNDEILYSFTVKGSDVYKTFGVSSFSTTLDFKSGSETLKKIYELTEGYNSVVYSFGSRGELPGLVEYKFMAPSEIRQPGNTIYIYRYDAEANSLGEPVETIMVPTNGYINLKLYKGGDYVLAADKIGGPKSADKNLPQINRENRVDWLAYAESVINAAPTGSPSGSSPSGSSTRAPNPSTGAK